MHPHENPLESNALNADLVSFRPSLEVQQRALGRGIDIAFHRIENGHGPVNLDYYPITVTALPTIDGHRLSASELLEYVRTHLPDFFDHSLATFHAYGTLDQQLWNSPSPTGAVMQWDMQPSWWNLYTGIDDGSVVVSESKPDHWIFSTVHSSGDFDHPVSGNREFGYTPQSDGTYVFYTRAADRATGHLDSLLSKVVFRGGEHLWQSFATFLADWINHHAGTAIVDVPLSERHDWDAVASSFHHPTHEWLSDGQAAGGDGSSGHDVGSGGAPGSSAGGGAPGQTQPGGDVAVTPGAPPATPGDANFSNPDGTASHVGVNYPQQVPASPSDQTGAKATDTTPASYPDASPTDQHRPESDGFDIPGHQGSGHHGAGTPHHQGSVHDGPGHHGTPDHDSAVSYGPADQNGPACYNPDTDYSAAASYSPAGHHSTPDHHGTPDHQGAGTPHHQGSVHDGPGHHGTPDHDGAVSYGPADQNGPACYNPDTDYSGAASYSPADHHSTPDHHGAGTPHHQGSVHDGPVCDNPDTDY
jgi:hypothetical protein